MDDHPLVRTGFSALIDDEPDLEICGGTGTVDEALFLASTLAPDLVIIDLSLADDGDGLDLIKRLSARDPMLKMVVLSGHDEALFAHRVLAAGAKGYINKREETTLIVDAIRRVLQGGLFVSQKFFEHALHQISRVHRIPVDPVCLLSDRELQIYRLVGSGNRSSQIAKQLYISVKTVESHKAKIKKKLNLASATELMRHAMIWCNRDA